MKNNTEASSQPQILLIEDSTSQALVYLSYLKKSGLVADHIETGGAGLMKIKENPPALVLLDLELPDIPGMSILKYINDNRLPCVVVIITGHGTINIAVEAMQAGAFDFLTKPFDAHLLNSTVANALNHQRLSQQLRKDKGDSGRTYYQGFIGASDAMKQVYQMIDNIASSKASVFICGESGTGKELCAEAIHQKSVRASGPFLALNCASIPKELMESEFFGHVKGAFTGAHTDRTGAVELADGGTLFLDEICEMDLELQSKLLRFIQTGVYRKVGSGKERKVDIRFVCATNRSPLEEVSKGNFREDLYYRLHVIPLNLPPLRDRGKDVVLIANHLLKRYAAEENRIMESFSSQAEEVLCHYQWPGNVRQMQNVIRLIAVLNNVRQITPELLPAPLNDVVAIYPSVASQSTAPEGVVEAVLTGVEGSRVEGARVEGARVEGSTAEGSTAEGSTAEGSTAEGSTAEQGWRQRRQDRRISDSADETHQDDDTVLQFRRKTDLGYLIKEKIEPFGVYEKKIIEAAISSCEGNVPEAATQLGLSPSTLYRKIQSWKSGKK